MKNKFYFYIVDKTNIPGFGANSNIQIITKPKNNKLKTLLSAEEIVAAKEEKQKPMNLIELVGSTTETESNAPVFNTTSNLKLLMSWIYVEPKIP